MVLMTGKKALMEMLRVEGTKFIFGNPGTSESPIMDALEEYPELEYILVLQEGVAIGMADAYARATGKPSFVNLHIETGLANGISLINNADEVGTPIVLTAANKDVRELAHGRTDLVAMLQQFTKWSAEVSHPGALPVVMQRAFNEAKTPPTGTSFISFSANALDDKAEVDIVPSPQTYMRIRPDKQAIENAARIMSAATNPIIVLGDRIAQSKSVAEAISLAELLGAKVYASSYTEMNFPTSHPQFMGRLRLAYPESRELLSIADVVLAVGKLAGGYYMFSQPTMRFFGPQTSLIHIDSDPSEIGKTQHTEVGIIADPKVALSELSDAIHTSMTEQARKSAQSRTQILQMEKEAKSNQWRAHVKKKWDHKPMFPERMIAEISKVLPSDVIIADDAVTTGLALHNTICFDSPGSVYGGRGGALGWGIGGAMGLKLANPDRPVIAVLGDGSAMMTIQGLWTAANYNIPVVYVICNNRNYRVLKINMNAYKNLIMSEKDPTSRYIGMEFPLPLNIAEIAKAYGIHARRIEDPTEICSSLEEAFNLGKPAVLDVVIDGSV